MSKGALLPDEQLHRQCVARAGASPPIPLALSCHWDGGGVGTVEHVSKG